MPFLVFYVGVVACHVMSAVSCQMAPLRTALEKCKEDNASLSEALDEKIRRQDEMETKLQLMIDDLERKSHLLKELRTAR